MNLGDYVTISYPPNDSCYAIGLVEAFPGTFPSSLSYATIIRVRWLKSDPHIPSTTQRTANYFHYQLSKITVSEEEAAMLALAGGVTNDV